MPQRWKLTVGPLSESEQAEVTQIAALAAEHDGVAPLSEAPLLYLGTVSPSITHAIVRGKLTDDADSAHTGELLGYLQVDRGGEMASAELVVHPQARRLGIGRALLKVAEADARLPAHSGGGLSAGKPLCVWAHGDLSAAQDLAAAAGLVPQRELLLLSRPLHGAGSPAENSASGDSPPLPKLPSGYQLRTFQPGLDDDAWIALNALVFAAHPEQGRLTVTDLQARMAEPWFDQRGFHLVTHRAGDGGSGDEMVAFCWTKAPSGETAGEIYAIGVHPEHQRRGLAAGLLATSLHHLAASGLSEVTLYVEGANEPALAAYYTSGFHPVSADVQYGKAD